MREREREGVCVCNGCLVELTDDKDNSLLIIKTVIQWNVYLSTRDTEKQRERLSGAMGKQFWTEKFGQSTSQNANLDMDALDLAKGKLIERFV